MDLTRNMPLFDEFLKMKIEKNEHAIGENLNLFEAYVYAERDAYDFLAESLMGSGYFSCEEMEVLHYVRKCGLVEDLINDRMDVELFEKSFVQWVEDKGKQAIAAVKTGAKAAGTASIKVISTIGQKIGTYIKFIVDKIREMLQKSWAWIKEATQKALDKYKEKFMKDAKSVIDPKQLKTEFVEFKDMSLAGISYLTSGIVGEMETAIDKTSKDDVKEAAPEAQAAPAANESFTIGRAITHGLAQAVYENPEMLSYVMSFSINEAEAAAHGEHDAGSTSIIPGVSWLATKVNKLPPFSWLHHVEAIVTGSINKILGGISKWLTKVGKVPGPYEFNVMGKLISMISAYGLKEGIKQIISSIGLSLATTAIAVALPVLGEILVVLKYIAKGIWITKILEVIISGITGMMKGGKEQAKPAETAAEKPAEPVTAETK